MPCGCQANQTQEWVFKHPNGQEVVYSKEIQAKVAKINAGGGTITSRPKR